MVAAVRDCEFVILVAEPTPFGLHDLSLAVDTLRKIEVPFAVVINRADIGDSRVQTYCAEQRVPILLELPEDLRIASVCSEGRVVVDCLPEYVEPFRRLRDEVLSRISRGAVPQRKNGLDQELETWEQGLARLQGLTREAGGTG